MGRDYVMGGLTKTIYLYADPQEFQRAAIEEHGGVDKKTQIALETTFTRGRGR